MSSHGFTARWPGVCRACTTPIKVGDRIRHWPNGDPAALAHETCPAAALIQTGGSSVEAVRAHVQLPGSKRTEILIPSASAVAAATIAARAVAAGKMAAVPKAAPDQQVQARRRRRPGGRIDRAADDPRLPAPGTLVQGRYRGQTITAEILTGGHVRMDGVEYPTLSTAAKVARGGIPTSGFVFFGLD